MVDDSEFLEDFVEQIKSSRENALASKYDDALAFYDGCFLFLALCLQCPCGVFGAACAGVCFVVPPEARQSCLSWPRVGGKDYIN